ILSASNARSVFVGEPVQLRLRLESSSSGHQAIALGWDSEQLEQTDVDPERQVEVALTLPAVHRGWLRAPRLRVESVFPLGAARVAARRFDAPHALESLVARAGADGQGVHRPQRSRLVSGFHGVGRRHRRAPVAPVLLGAGIVPAPATVRLAPAGFSVRRGHDVDPSCPTDSARQPELAVDRPGTGHRAVRAAHSRFPDRLVAGLHVLAHPDLPHARADAGHLGQVGFAGGDRGRDLSRAGQPGRAGCRGGAADRRVHPENAGDADPARRAGADFPWVLLRCRGLSVRGRDALGAVHAAADCDLAGRA
nr:hypothetical protein [Tanacetum cinerariifolium]